MDYYEFRLRTQPEIAYFSGIEIERHDGMYDNSPQALARERAAEDELIQQLEQIDAAGLRGGVDWITHGILRQALISARDLQNLPQRILGCQPNERLATLCGTTGRAATGG